MTTRILLFFLFTSLSLYGFGQKPRIAVINKDKSSLTKIENSVNDQFILRLLDNDQIDHYIYEYKNSKLSYISGDSISKNEVVCDYVLTYSYDLFEDLSPELKFKKDTSGKTLYAYYVLNPGYNFGLKLTNISTSELVYSIQKFEKDRSIYSIGPYSSNGKEIIIKIADYKKYFKKGEDGYKNVYNKYKGTINKYYSNKIEQAVNSIYKKGLTYFFPRLIPVDELVIEKEKVKKFSVPTSKTVINHNVYIYLFHLDSIGQYVVPTIYGKYSLHKDSDSIRYIIKSTALSKPKKAAKAHLLGRQLYCSIGRKGYSEKISDNIDPIIIRTNISNKQLQHIVESQLCRSPKIVVANYADGMINEFHDRYKGENFINSYFQPFLLGANYIISLEGERIEIVNIENSRVIGSSPAYSGYRGIYCAFQDALGLEIEIIKNFDLQKKKAKKLLLYSPLGFDEFVTSSIDVSRTLKENVAGNIVERNELIGQGNVQYYNIYGNFIAELSLTKGEKEVFEAIMDGSKLKFRPHL